MTANTLPMWTVYDHTRDFLDCFVARMFLVDGPEPKPTAQVVLSTSLDEVRRAMVTLGLTCITRSPGDDPAIVETWL